MLPNDLTKTYSFPNLYRAWKWIKSNPQAEYKNYFRPLYSAYASTENSYIKSLYRRLNDNTYRPSPSTKIFNPKPSGILRPITLISVEDQIVYQAFANQIAIRLNRRIRNRYLKKIFGHIYAGVNSIWFYEDWKICYACNLPQKVDKQ